MIGIFVDFWVCFVLQIDVPEVFLVPCGLVHWRKRRTGWRRNHGFGSGLHPLFGTFARFLGNL